MLPQNERSKDEKAKIKTSFTAAKHKSNQAALNFHSKRPEKQKFNLYQKISKARMHSNN